VRLGDASYGLTCGPATARMAWPDAARDLRSLAPRLALWILVSNANVGCRCIAAPRSRRGWLGTDCVPGRLGSPLDGLTECDRPSQGKPRSCRQFTR
jgi:hypothetical protein